jgi:eukaryotic-like serine/threonine-protein kinase
MVLSILLSPGNKIYKYELKRNIGSGNFGEVWLAHDFTISKNVAVKILDNSMAPIAQHLQEAQTGNRLNHQNVVKVHYADVVTFSPGGELAIIAMDFHPAGSTVGQLNSSNFMPLKIAIQIIIDVLRGLEYLHEQNLFHNDIKPSNILIGSRGEGILTDYGISCVSQKLQPTQALSSYILHRAPETIKLNQISTLTDIYQVGITLFRLINGIGLVQEQANKLGIQQFESYKFQEKVPNSKDYQPFVTRRVKSIINKAVKVDPNERYQSALEMRRALESLNILGYWTTDALGQYVGHYSKSIFTFAIQKNRNGIKFESFRERLDSGKKVRISSHSANSLSKTHCDAKKQQFMQAVVEGNI